MLLYRQINKEMRDKYEEILKNFGVIADVG